MLTGISVSTKNGRFSASILPGPYRLNARPRFAQSHDTIWGFPCSSIFSKDLLTLILPLVSPLYSMKPNCRNLFMKKLTWVRLVSIN